MRAPARLAPASSVTVIVTLKRALRQAPEIDRQPERAKTAHGSHGLRAELDLRADDLRGLDVAQADAKAPAADARLRRGQRRDLTDRDLGQDPDGVGALHGRAVAREVAPDQRGGEGAGVGRPRGRADARGDHAGAGVADRRADADVRTEGEGRLRAAGDRGRDGVQLQRRSIRCSSRRRSTHGRSASRSPSAASCRTPSCCGSSTRR